MSVTLITIENATEAQLADLMKAANPPDGSVGRHYTGVVWDSGVCCEAATDPDIRMTPLQPKLYAKCVNAYRKARCTTDGRIRSGDIVILTDAGKDGTLPAINRSPACRSRTLGPPSRPGQARQLAWLGIWASIVAQSRANRPRIVSK